MIHVPKRRGWEIPEREATPESAVLHRRDFLKRMGLAGLAVAAGGALMGAGRALGSIGLRGTAAGPSPFAAPRNPKFVLDRPITDPAAASAHAEFREFCAEKRLVAGLARAMNPRPWRIEISGFVRRPRSIDVDELIRRMPLEERLYRHSCREGWAKAVPWTGFPLSALVKWAEPLSFARHLTVTSFYLPEVAPGQGNASWTPWPYRADFQIEEAMNELAFVAVGMYGHALPKEHGAPLRLVMPWLWAHESVKSVVRLEFKEKDKFHSLVQGWVPSVMPNRGFDRGTERLIGTDERRPTLLFNGYGEWVAGMYPRHPMRNPL